ncbi:hypothetical protein [Larkinella punicea]|uniref:Lipocalin-like domain-containing protein n=1 Tax=Larkinella punicea TaxID=2315727 RepID=A0A368JMF0_9BACT|nr:hypothetical protein [Larkinella punicea]RCR67743.1 hypothetical protein DUE52_20300 [Larkinella punicea]
MKIVKLLLILSVLLVGCSKDSEEVEPDPDLASQVVGKYQLLSITVGSAVTNFPNADGRRGEYDIVRTDDTNVKIITSYYLAGDKLFASNLREGTVSKSGDTYTVNATDKSVFTIKGGNLTDSSINSENQKIVSVAKK